MSPAHRDHGRDECGGDLRLEPGSGGDVCAMCVHVFVCTCVRDVCSYLLRLRPCSHFLPGSWPLMRALWRERLSEPEPGKIRGGRRGE